MTLKRECIVYPTARCIRTAVESYEHSILPHFMSMGEFLSRAGIAHGRITPDDDLRLLALHEAADFSTFSSLQIDRNFFSFIQNAQYIFRFFEELSSEQVQIQTLADVDVYGEYEEHIAILIQLRSRYHEICEKNGWNDPIFWSENTQINTGFLSHYDSVHIEVEGYLSRREIGILLECARVVPLSIGYTTTPYNRKMTSRFEEMGFVLNEGRRYRLSLSDTAISSEESLEKNTEILCETFNSRIAQIGFVKSKIEAFVEDGIAPENIAVVLPDESFAPMLASFDREENFNFAMGYTFDTTSLYAGIESVMLYLDESNVLNKERIRNIPSELIELMRGQYAKRFDFDQLRVLYEMAAGIWNDENAYEIVKDELQRFTHLTYALEKLDFKSVLRIFMNRLRNRTIDDTRGGKITVMGVLETRGSVYEGVIVVDFNEGFVPHKSDKDLFLNTKTRQYAALPTANDRESLQKHYYAMLFNRARKVAIGSVQNAESVPSRFLLQMKIPIQQSRYRYEEILFQNKDARGRHINHYEGEYDFTAHPLSASSLKSFLTCKRQFFYRYLLHLSPHELPRDLSEERDIGNVLHATLESIYRSRERYNDPEEIKRALERSWERMEEDDALQRHMKRLWLEKLDPFCENEVRRFEEGWRVLYREKELHTTIEGIKLTGRVDRIDERGGKLEVVDYKSGKYPETDKAPKEDDVDYQLSVYAFLASSLGEIEGCGYYDLNRGKVVREQYLEEKNDRLRDILRTLASQKMWVWEMCEELSRCRLCPYVYMCQREALRGV